MVKTQQNTLGKHAGYTSLDQYISLIIIHWLMQVRLIQSPWREQWGGARVRRREWEDKKDSLYEQFHINFLVIVTDNHTACVCFAP